MPHTTGRFDFMIPFHTQPVEAEVTMVDNHLSIVVDNLPPEEAKFYTLMIADRALMGLNVVVHEPTAQPFIDAVVNAQKEQKTMEFIRKQDVVEAIQFTGGKKSAKAVIKWLKKHYNVRAIHRKAAEDWEFPFKGDPKNKSRRMGQGWSEAVVYETIVSAPNELSVINVDEWAVKGHRATYRNTLMEDLEVFTILPSDLFFALYEPK